jgi:hypothetical protein
VAVIVNIVVWLTLVVLVSEPEIELPDPLEMPVTFDVLSLVHEIIVPDTLFGFVKLTDVMASPEQIVWDAEETLTVGVGFTVMVNVLATPVHPFNEGVTVMVAVTGVFPVLTAANAAMFPVPLAARPIEVVLFVQV